MGDSTVIAAVVVVGASLAMASSLAAALILPRIQHSKPDPGSVVSPVAAPGPVGSVPAPPPVAPGPAPGPSPSVGNDEGGGLDPPVDATGATIPTAADGESSHFPCRTYMGDQNDDGSCFKLVYDHCIPGFTDESKIPDAIRGQMQGVLDQAFAQGGQGSFHGGRPKKFTRVCVADPAMLSNPKCLQHAGTDGNGKSVTIPAVKSGDYRVHMRGFRPSNFGICQHKPKIVSYVKAHVAPDGTIYNGMLGNVGH